MNPGSKEARTAGCKCPVIDNNYGLGFPFEGRTEFWTSEACELHAVIKRYEE